MSSRPVARPQFAQSCEERTPMVFLIVLVVLLLGARAALALARAWRAVPRSNADFEVFR
jgi:hypothetical protein